MLRGCLPATLLTYAFLVHQNLLLHRHLNLVRERYHLFILSDLISVIIIAILSHPKPGNNLSGWDLKGLQTNFKRKPLKSYIMTDLGERRRVSKVTQ